MTQQKNKKKSREVSDWGRIKSFAYFALRQISVTMFLRFIKNLWWEDV